MSGPAGIEAGSSVARATGRNGGLGQVSHPRRLLARGWQWACRSKGRSGRGITLDVSGPAQPSQSRAKWVFALLLFLSITAVAVAEYSAGRWPSRENRGTVLRRAPRQEELYFHRGHGGCTVASDRHHWYLLHVLNGGRRAHSLNSRASLSFRRNHR